MCHLQAPVIEYDTGFTAIGARIDGTEKATTARILRQNGIEPAQQGRLSQSTLLLADVKRAPTFEYVQTVLYLLSASEETERLVLDEQVLCLEIR